METAYFPLDAVMSLIATDSDGRTIEIASVGREGVLGLPGALDGGLMVGEAVQQVSGRHARIAMSDLRAEVERRGTLSAVLERYTVALLSQVAQSLICLRHHRLDARAARWLLATHDRVQRDEFVLTQDFLSVMLGVTRPQLTLVAASLRRAGLIDYKRGHVVIRDRKGLEGVACECYEVIKTEFARLLGDGNGWQPVGG
jgi:CRP-like cAMP-binding protein